MAASSIHSVARRWASVQARAVRAAATTADHSATQDSPSPFQPQRFATAYRGKAFSEVLRAYTVLTACGFTPLVDRAVQALALAERVMGQRLLYGVVRRSFFAHFCGGEQEAEVQRHVAALRAGGVGTIVNYAAEASVEADPAEVQRAVNFNFAKFMESLQVRTVAGVVASLPLVRLFPYPDLTPLRQLAEQAGFVAVKCTALIHPLSLRDISDCVASGRLSRHDVGRGEGLEAAGVASSSAEVRQPAHLLACRQPPAAFLPATRTANPLTRPPATRRRTAP